MLSHRASLERFNRESIDRLKNTIKNGDGILIKYGPEESVSYRIEKDDIARAKKTIKNLSKPLTNEYVSQIKKRMIEILSMSKKQRKDDR